MKATMAISEPQRGHENGATSYTRLISGRTSRACWAANPGKALFEISTLEKGRHGTFDDRPPEAVLGLKPLVVHLLEGLKMLADQTPLVLAMTDVTSEHQEGFTFAPAQSSYEI